MKTPSTLLAALLLTLAAAAHADTTSSAPAKPVTGQGAATTVSTNPAEVKSGGKADKGLDTAVSNINKPKHHTGKHTGTGKSERSEKSERGEHPSRVEQPSRPERPGR